MLSSEDEAGVDRLARARNGRRDRLAGRRLAGRRSPRGSPSASACRIRSTPATGGARDVEDAPARGVRGGGRAARARASTRRSALAVSVRRQGARPPGPARAHARAATATSSRRRSASAIAESRGGGVLVEELVEGPEVTVNAFSVDGRFVAADGHRPAHRRAARVRRRARARLALRCTTTSRSSRSPRGRGRGARDPQRADVHAGPPRRRTARS